jgi:FkbM family methyltransferase
MSKKTSGGWITRVLRLIPFSYRDQIKTVPGLAQLQRMVVSGMLNGHEFEHRVDAGPAKGITFVVKMPDDKGIWTGTYEVDFATRIAASIEPGAVAYDIGGWHGFFGGVMAAQEASQVHIFEPLPANAERIRRLIELNPSYQINLHEVAVGEGESEMDLLMMPETSMAKLETSTFQPKAGASDRMRVKVRSIDSMVSSGEISAPSVIKVDVEGAELMVFKGAIETIRRYHPIIFAEVHSSGLLTQCQNLLEGLGYQVELIDENPVNALSRDVFQIKATARALG